MDGIPTSSLRFPPGTISAEMPITGVLNVVTQTGEATHFIGDVTLTQPPTSVIEHRWFAIQTKARHEKRVATQLEEKGVTAFLPLSIEVHQWSDRKRQVELPLFSTYVFVRVGGEQSSRVKVLQTHGVFSFVGVRGIGSPIPDEQIETLNTIIREKVSFSQHPFLNIGQKVRVRGGSLDGICGVLSAINNDRSLIVSVDSIQRSLAIRVEGYSVEPI
jgi:transcription antitermination factor NusG